MQQQETQVFNRILFDCLTSSLTPKPKLCQTLALPGFCSSTFACFMLQNISSAVHLPLGIQASVSKFF